MPAHIVLATLPGRGPDRRLRVALSQGADGCLALDLREQHFAEGIGWFDQRTLELEPRQVRQLQAVLGLRAAPLGDAAEETPATIPFPVPGPRHRVGRPTGSDA